MTESDKVETARLFAGAFWEDKKIVDLFKPRDGETVDETLEWRIERLE